MPGNPDSSQFSFDAERDRPNDSELDQDYREEDKIREELETEYLVRLSLIDLDQMLFEAARIYENLRLRGYDTNLWKKVETVRTDGGQLRRISRILFSMHDQGHTDDANKILSHFGLPNFFEK